MNLQMAPYITGVVDDKGNIQNLSQAMRLVYVTLASDSIETYNDYYKSTDIIVPKEAYQARRINNSTDMVSKDAYQPRWVNSRYATEYKEDYNPDWMEVTTYTQGRGFDCYIILHNQAGTMIRADGTLRIEIFEDDSKLWSKSYPVNASDFADTTLGLGSFAHPATIWDAGRISYDTIKPGLGDLSLKNSVYLEVRAYFDTNDGRTLGDKTTEYVS